MESTVDSYEHYLCIYIHVYIYTSDQSGGCKPFAVFIHHISGTPIWRLGKHLLTERP